MKLSAQNIHIAFLIAYFWSVSSIRITFLRPSSYLPEIVLNNKAQHILSEKEWIIVRKTVKGVRRISPLFVKRRKCLMEAIIVFKTLKRLGIVSLFRVGASNKEKTLSTHAWVSVEDIIVIGGSVNGYEELIRTH